MKRAPLVAFHNKNEIAFCKKCGCYNCCKIFDKEEIKKWTDNFQTALCPFCEVDTVLPDSAYDLAEELLKDINKYWINKKDKEIL